MSENPTLPTTEIVVFDGFDDLDAIAPLEILVAAGFPARVVRPADHPSTVRSAHGLILEVADTLGDAPGLLVVPGGGWLDRGSGVRDQCEGPLPATVAARHEAGTVVASVCTGAMVLARAGLVTGRPAVTNQQALDDLAAAGADVRAEARVVDDGSVVTAGGPAAGIDLSIRLVTRFAGEDAGRAAAARLEHQPVGPVLVGVAAGYRAPAPGRARDQARPGPPTRPGARTRPRGRSAEDFVLPCPLRSASSVSERTSQHSERRSS